MSSPNIRLNTSNGIDFIASNTNTHASISDAMIFANGGKGVNILGGAEQIALSNCQIVNNTSDGIYCNGQLVLQVNGGLLERNGGWGYNEGATGSRNNLAGALRVVGNTAGGINLNSTARTTKVDASVLDYTPNSGTNGDIVPSAATITLPGGGQVFFVTGTTSITSITPSWRGRHVTLLFTDVLTVTNGGNLILAGSANFVTKLEDSLTLVCDGNNWLETSRSAN